MKNKWENRCKVFYHAISSYQLLECMLHRMTKHPNADSTLVLPDFIIEKYPNWKRLKGRFFDRVFLFPYGQIPHQNEAQILLDTKKFAERLLPFPIQNGALIYVAGAHFYFSLYLITQNIPFTAFEDAAGLYQNPARLKSALSALFPFHAALADRYGLIDLSHPLIQTVICQNPIPASSNPQKQLEHFSVENVLEALPHKERKKVISFFLRKKIRTKADGILLTQQFSNQGLLSKEAQLSLYQTFFAGPLKQTSLIIKKHPDDPLHYRAIFPGAQIIKPIFPSELLPYVFTKKPKVIYTWDSTGCENLKHHFQICRLGGDNGVPSFDHRQFGVPADDRGTSEAIHTKIEKNRPSFDRHSS